jgi:hypothetical protein
MRVAGRVAAGSDDVTGGAGSQGEAAGKAAADVRERNVAEVADTSQRMRGISGAARDSYGIHSVNFLSFPPIERQ